MYTNTDLTVYNYIKIGLVEFYKPFFVGRAFLDHVKQSNIRQSGLSTVDAVSALVPYNTAFTNIYTGLSTEFTLDTNGKDFIVVGNHTTVVTGATSQEVSNNLKSFRAGKQIYMINNVDIKLNGSINMWHYEVGCK